MLHTLIVLLVGATLFPLGIYQEGMFLMSAFYIGREHSQAEYRSITTYYGSKRSNAPWWCGFEPRVWNKKSLLDWVSPLTASVVTAIVL